MRKRTECAVSAVHNDPLSGIEPGWFLDIQMSEGCSGDRDVTMSDSPKSLQEQKNSVAEFSYKTADGDEAHGQVAYRRRTPATNPDAHFYFSGDCGGHFVTECRSVLSKTKRVRVAFFANTNSRASIHADIL